MWFVGETAGTPRARALAAALREAREASGFGVTGLARRLNISHTQISLWESGRRVPNIENVAMVLAALGTLPEERERILKLARNVREPNWLTVGVEGVPAQLAGVVECERAASLITEWIPMGIPGLLQTYDYRRAISRSDGFSTNDMELRVMVSASRCEVITRRREPTRFVALIGETGLHEVLDSNEVMVEQLRHLLDMARRPNITVRVVPLHVGWHPGWNGPFIVYDFPSSPPVVYFEHYSSGAFIPDEHDVRSYRRAVERISEVALSPDESMRLIEKVATELESDTG
jgi:transcriptional regulator with XRE-family HTH domain